MPPVPSTPKQPERIYSVHLKPQHKPHVVAVGLAADDIEDIIAWMWGKDTALYLLEIDDIEYDLTCHEGIEEKIRAVVDFHEAFYGV